MFLCIPTHTVVQLDTLGVYDWQTAVVDVVVDRSSWGFLRLLYSHPIPTHYAGHLNADIRNHTGFTCCVPTLCWNLTSIRMPQIFTRQWLRSHPRCSSMLLQTNVLWWVREEKSFISETCTSFCCSAVFRAFCAVKNFSWTDLKSLSYAYLSSFLILTQKPFPVFSRQHSSLK